MHGWNMGGEVQALAESPLPDSASRLQTARNGELTSRPPWLSLAHCVTPCSVVLLLDATYPQPAGRAPCHDLVMIDQVKLVPQCQT